MESLAELHPGRVAWACRSGRRCSSCGRAGRRRTSPRPPGRTAVADRTRRRVSRPRPGCTSSSVRSNSRPRVQTTCSDSAGTATVTSWPWKNGRWWTSHFASTPSGNQAPPLESVTDHRAHRGDESRSSAAADGRIAPSTLNVSSPSTTVNTGSAPSRSIVSIAAPRGPTRTSRPATVSERSASTAESTTTSIATVCPAIAGRAGPMSARRPPPSSIRTTTMPGGTLVADHRTDGLRPVAGLRDRFEDRSEQGEAGPPEEVRELLVAPVPPALDHGACGSGPKLRSPLPASSAYLSPGSTWHLLCLPGWIGPRVRMRACLLRQVRRHGDLPLQPGRDRRPQPRHGGCHPRGHWRGSEVHHQQEHVVENVRLPDAKPVLAGEGHRRLQRMARAFPHEAADFACFPLLVVMSSFPRSWRVRVSL